MNCRICANIAAEVFTAEIQRKHDVTYYQCTKCSFLQTDEPFWLEEAYKESINKNDTGIISRNNYLSRVASVIIYYLFNKNGKFVDYAGGYGIFTRLMRDIGFDFYWYDLYTKNLLSKGFEFNINENVKIELITSFEAFEHFVNPLVEIEKMLAISPNILFSTEILPAPIPKPSDWWYYGVNHGQHISFYKTDTLSFIAREYDLKFYSNRVNVHLFTKKTISPQIFKYLIKFVRFGLDIYVKKRMKSRTMNDSIALSRI